MIDIKDISGKTRFSTAITEGAKGQFALMKEDYVVFPFNTESPIGFRMGDYVDLRGVFDASMGSKFAKIYDIVDMSYPTYKDGEYKYELRLDAYYWKWKTKIFKYTPEVGGQEASWSLTASLEVHLDVFLRNLKSLGYTYDGDDFECVIDDSVDNTAKLMTYDNINLLDSMFSMAETWECDCWVKGNIIHFGRCEFSDPIKIEIDVESKEMTRSDSKGTYATRIYAFGSTRNIPSSYRKGSESVVVGGIAERRLMLPKGITSVDAYEGMTDQEAIEAVVVFDSVYPRRIGEISEVTSYESEVDNEDGTKTKATFFRFKDLGINFSKEYILERNELKIQFQSGRLNGMEFGVVFNPLGLSEKKADGTWNPDAQLWEIVLNEDYGRPLPDDILLPAISDTYVLSGWNSEKITELGLVSSAEQELLTEARKYVAKTCVDDGTYTTTLNSVFVNENQVNHSFDIGQRVNLVNPVYFKSGRISRIIGFEIKLDLPFDSPEYTIGESAAYSRISDMEEKIENLTFKGKSYTGSGGGSVFVIKTTDSIIASNSNVFSALLSLQMFLRRNVPDEAEELITFLKGLLIGKNGSGIRVLPDGTSQAVVDRLYVKIKAVFDELEVKKATHVGGEQIISHAGMKCVNVEERKDAYRCYFLSKLDGVEIKNEFSIGSLARSKECNIIEGTTLNAANRYYWREVIGTGRDYIDLSKTVCDKGSDIPQVGDDIIGFGHRTDLDLQSAIVLSSTNETSPSVVLYAGINDFTLLEKDAISFGHDKFTGNSYLKVYGDSYTGARDQSTYIKYTIKDGVEIKGRFLSEAGEDIMTKFSVIEGMVKSEISSVRSEINQKDNYLSNALFANGLTGWVGNSNIRIFTVNGKLFLFNNNLYANKEAVANIVAKDNRNVLRIKNGSIMQLNADFSTHPEFEESKTDAGKLFRPRMFYVSFKYKCLRSGTLRVYFKDENPEGFEVYDPVDYTIDLQPSDEFKVMEFSGKWNGTGDFVIGFSGDIYLYSLALSENRLADMEERFATKFEQTDKMIKLNADKIVKNGEKLEEYHGELTVTAQNIRAELTEGLNQLETGLTESYKGYVDITARGLSSEFNSRIDDVDGNISSHTGSFHVTSDKIEGMVSQTTELGTNYSLLSIEVGKIKTNVSSLDGRFSSITQEVDKVKIEVSDARGESATISAELGRIEGRVGVLGGNLSVIEQTANEIESKVGTANGNLASLQITANGIAQQVIDSNRNIGALQVSADQIVQKLIGADGNISSITSRLGSVEVIAGYFDSMGRLKEGAGWVTTSEANNLWVKKGGIISSINQTAESITINASRVNLRGAVSMETFSDDLKISYTQTVASISAVAGRFNPDGTLKEGAGWVTSADANSWWVKKNGVISAINQTAESVSIDANKINLNGVVTANGNFKIKLDGSIETNKGTFKNVLIQGSTRSPFVRETDSIVIGIDQSTHDNVATISDDGTWLRSGVLEWDVNQSGRRMCITNYLWEGKETKGIVVYSAPAGQFFYEDGVSKRELMTYRECVELMGYGTSSKFYGWIVLNRIDLMQQANRIRDENLVLWCGRYSTGNGAITTCGNGIKAQPSIVRISTGGYRVTHNMGHTNYFVSAIPSLYTGGGNRWGIIPQYDSLGVNSFNLQFKNDGGNDEDPREFMLVIYGKNEWRY